MVKFSEVFEYLGRKESDMTCDCCKNMHNVVYIFKYKGGVALLCESCKEFLEELFD